MNAQKVPRALLPKLLTLLALCGIIGCGPLEEGDGVGATRQGIAGKTQIVVLQSPAYGPKCALHVMYNLPGKGTVDNVCDFTSGSRTCEVTFDNSGVIPVRLEVDCSRAGKSVVNWWSTPPCGRFNRLLSDGSASPNCEFNASDGVVYETGFHTCNGTNVKGFCQEATDYPTLIGKEVGAIGVVAKWNSVTRGEGPLPGGVWIAPGGYSDVVYYFDRNNGVVKEYKIPPSSAGATALIHVIKAQPTEDHLLPSGRALFAGQREPTIGGTRKETWFLMYYDPSIDKLVEVNIPAMGEDENLKYPSYPSTTSSFREYLRGLGGFTNLAVSPDGNEVTVGMLVSSITGDAPLAWFRWNGSSYIRGRVFQTACAAVPLTGPDYEMIRLDKCPLGSSLAGYVAADGTYNPYMVGENGVVYKGVVDTRPPAPTLGFEVAYRLPRGGTYPRTSGCEPDGLRQIVSVMVAGTEVAAPGNRLGLLCSQGRYLGTGRSRVTFWWLDEPTASGPIKIEQREGWISGYTAPTTATQVVAYRPLDTGYISKTVEYWQPKSGRPLFSEMTMVGKIDELYFGIGPFYGHRVAFDSSSVCQDPAKPMDCYHTFAWTQRHFVPGLPGQSHVAQVAYIR